MTFRTRAHPWGIVVLAAVLLAGCANDIIVKSPPGTTTTLILMRHAERTPLTTDLNEVGRATAAALPEAFEGTHIDAIYSPDMSRNLDTVAPLAKQRGLAVKVIDLSWVAARLIRENAGKTVLWVGNSGNLTRIYDDLGGEGRPPTLYGDLYIVRVPDQGPAQVTKSSYRR